MFNYNEMTAIYIKIDVNYCIKHFLPIVIYKFYLAIIGMQKPIMSFAKLQRRARIEFSSIILNKLAFK